MKKNVLMLALLTILFCINTAIANPNTISPVLKTIDAPTLNLFDGQNKITLKKFRGNYLLINFWATWCPACVAEMASLDTLAQKLANKNLKVIAVNLNEGGQSEAQNFIDKLKLKKTIVLFDLDGSANKEYAIRGLPTTYLISPEGKLIARLEGSAIWDDPLIIKQIEKYMIHR
jgi:thiol-disulfide isomerase/thioredoxin